LGYNSVKKVDSYQAAVEQIKLYEPTLVISDFKLNDGFTGVDLANELKYMQIPFIFMTAYNDIENYELTKNFENSKFIVKPFDKLTIKSLIDDFKFEKENLDSSSFVRSKFLFIRNGKIYDKICIDDIRLINSEGNYCTFYGMEKKYVLKTSLIKILDTNAFSEFIRVHRNYAINLIHVKSVNFNDKIIKLEKEEIPIGKSFQKSARSSVLALKV